MPKPSLYTPLLLAALILSALTLVSCGPKKDNASVAALKNEKNAWERESNSVANEATAATEAETSKKSQETDEVQ